MIHPAFYPMTPNRRGESEGGHVAAEFGDSLAGGNNMNAEVTCTAVHHRTLVLAGLAAVDCGGLASLSGATR